MRVRARAYIQVGAETFARCDILPVQSTLRSILRHSHTINNPVNVFAARYHVHDARHVDLLLCRALMYLVHLLRRLIPTTQVKCNKRNTLQVFDCWSCDLAFFATNEGY